ncbi:MAG: polysaccharide biosynthesis tyrosine autokinase [Pseudomonadota bacterium]
MNKRTLERPGGGAPRAGVRRELHSLFEMAEIDRAGLDFNAMLTALQRRKWSVILITTVFVALAVWHLRSVTPLYPAEATVVLDTKDDQVIDIQAVSTGLSSDYFAINTEVEVLKSRRLIGRLVDDMKLVEDPDFNVILRARQNTQPTLLMQARTLLGLPNEPVELPVVPLDVQRDRTIDFLIDRLNVSNISATYVFKLSISTPDREKSARLINRLSDLYILEQLEAKFDATQAATTWLSGRVADLKISLERAEAKVEAFSATTQLISEEELELESRALKELRDRADQYIVQANETQVKLDKITEARAAQDIDRITELLASPRVMRAARQVASIQGDSQQARQRRTLALTNYWNEVENQLIQLRQQRERLRSQAEASGPAVAEFEAKIEQQGKDLVILRQLMREAEASRLIYEHFLARMKEISVQEGIQSADARVLSAAIPKTRPSYPRWGQTLMLALLLGGMTGTGWALWRESRTSTFRSAEDLEKATGVRVLGNIPRAPIRRRRDLLNYVIKKPSSSLAESVRDLRTSLLLADMHAPPQVIVSSSSVPKEGKTTLTVLLAQNSAALGKRVLVVECDLRKRTLDAYFGGSKDQRGLISVLYGEADFADVVLHDELGGFDVLPGEESPVNAADVFSSLQFGQFIEAMREHYDFIIIDTPPVMAVPDARLIASLGDALIYSVAWDRTSRDVVRAGLNQFREVNVPMIGLALTQIDVNKASKYGYGGYGQYYKVGKGYYKN